MREALQRLDYSLKMPANFNAPELANFIAAQAVAVATSYLDGRSADASLARSADRLADQLQIVGDEPRCNAIADPTRMLVSAMAKTSTDGDGRWTQIMDALVPLLRKRSLQMRAGDLPRDNAGRSAAGDDEGILPGTLRP